MPSQVSGEHVQEERAERGSDWLDALWEDPEFGPKRPANEVPVWSVPPVNAIPDRDPSDDHLIDWDRVRAAVRAVHPVRTLAVVGVGVWPAFMWAERVAGPMARDVSVDAAFAVAVVTSVVAGVGIAAGRGFRRWACAALLVAIVGGTLLAAPTRNLIASWIVGA
ncbi:hypothetical protein OG897_40720 [Streptomyces sp. NBC_00237]|uniref:hypothetical protein n=1 Tax=Streptomyces sp. NBC_00237 TaxID=2975687 RepID=UPI002252B314|nr:hypothetical protein [Streptomyces sp. NBC_00237]MCX5207709.1 hypothetical protein [Streptomyces sp. NBC_00237]